MDREIKFRGKRKDNGEWVEGCLDWERAEGRSKAYFIHTGYDGGLEEFYEVDPATVGQFTGLKDKNGKEIWESDLVRLTSQYETDEPVDCVVQVVFREGAFRLNYFNMLISANIAASAGNWGIEVIGNIHENKELLDG